jgi:hypothetical protein
MTCPCPDGCNGCEKLTKQQIIDWLAHQTKLWTNEPGVPDTPEQLLVAGALEECWGLIESGHH